MCSADTIRLVDPDLPSRLDDEYIRIFGNKPDTQRGADYTQTHRNWPATGAVEYLKDMQSKFFDAQLIAPCDGSIWEADEPDVDPLRSNPRRPTAKHSSSGVWTPGDG